MIILHTSDWHLGKTIEGKSRIEEQRQFLEELIQIVKSNNVDMVILSGDVYDNGNPPAYAERMFYDALERISENGKRLTLVIAGNHDSPDRLVAARPLAMKHGVIMVGLPKTVIETGKYGKHHVVDSGEGYIEVDVKGERAVVLTVAYPSEKRLNEVLYHAMDEEDEKLKSYEDRIRTLFQELEGHFREDTVNLVVSHLFAMGSEEGGSERGIQLGGSYIVDGGCLPQKAQYIALGHIHKTQVVPNTNHKAWYAGAPIHYHAKEVMVKLSKETLNQSPIRTKNCLLVEVKAGEGCKVNKIPLTVYKPIEIWHCKSIEDAILRCRENTGKDSWVYMEVETENFLKSEDIKEMREHKEDILEIKPIFKGNRGDAIPVKDYEKMEFMDIFKEFYLYKNGREAEHELIDLLRSIMDGEEREDHVSR